MAEDPPNPLAQATLQRGRDLMAKMTEKPILERDVKAYFLKIASSYKAEVRKTEWYMRKDAPDWFVALNGAHFAELKRPGEVPRPSQQREFDRLARKGVVVHVLDTYDKVDDFFERISKCE